MPANDKNKEYRTLKESGVFILTGTIDEESTADAIEFILEANLNKAHKSLTLVINSGGGEVYSGFALIDVMQGSKIPVHTTGLGMIASMGLSIFMAGAKGHRVLTPNTMIMSHQFSAWTFGKEHELLATQKELDLLSKNLIAHYKRHTGIKSDAQVRAKLLPASDVWLTAAEAKKLGICDHVKVV
jgi:ATP-dependent Clp protease protease subunit